MIVDGYINDKNNQPVAGAIVELKDEHFVAQYMTITDQNGYYRLDATAGYYPFFIAVKGYKETGLEYWCQDINLNKNMSLNANIDTLEVYGLHAFTIKGAGNGLMVYFRPMSLEKYLRGNVDIAPEDILIKAIVDGKERQIININKVKEYAGGYSMDAYLVQIAIAETKNWQKLDIEIWDKNQNYGAASIFNNK